MTKKPRILIADDESQIRDIIAGAISDLGYTHVEAADGAAALEIIRAGQIDVIVSDVMMPKLSGMQLLEAIRTDGLETPFILVTGYGTKEYCIKALRLGAFDFIEKPFEIAEMTRVIATAARVGVAITDLLRLLEDDFRKKHGREPKTGDILEIRSIASMMALRYSKL
jgi:DNA-binding NtrC family response regulator